MCVAQKPKQKDYTPSELPKTPPTPAPPEQTAQTIVTNDKVDAEGRLKKKKSRAGKKALRVPLNHNQKSGRKALQVPGS